MQLRNPAVRTRRRPKYLFQLLRRHVTTAGANERLRNKFARWNRLKLRTGLIRHHLIGWRTLLDLHAEDSLDRFVGDIVFERFEDLERFFFVLDTRIFLPVAAQRNARLEMIHHVQMIDPLAVDDRQQEIALLDDAQHFGRYFLLLRLVRLDRTLAQQLANLFSILVLEIGNTDARLYREDQLERVEHLFEIPLARVRVLRRVFFNGLIDFRLK